MNHNRMPLIYGEVLYDCFPDGRENLGGAPFNVAWNLQAFGMDPILVSRVGDDTLGKNILGKMASWDMSTICLQIDPEYPTGKVRIEIDGNEPQFTILPDQAYDFIAPLTGDTDFKPSFIYHGSLALRNDVSSRTLNLLKQNFNCPVFVDVNLRTPWWNAEDVLPLIADATWLKLNEAELDLLFPGQDKPEKRCGQLLERFILDAVLITLGKKGAVALNSDNESVTTEPRKDISVTDTVGAGDAFSSVLLLGFMHNWPLETAMLRAQDFASAVVGLRGAVTEDKNFYKTFYKKWDL